MVNVNLKIPENVVKEIWTSISFDDIKKYILKENVKNIEEKYYNKKEDNYGIFENSLEAIKFLTRKRWS